MPKIIDFGIAKATTGQRLTDKSLFTAFEQFIGTPAYMSPEQAGLGGLDIRARRHRPVHQLSAATSPYANPLTAPQQFFRLI